MKCADVRAMAESYLAGELPVDTNHAIIAHLERCTGCQVELDARLALRQTLRLAFQSSAGLAPDPRFIARLHEGVRGARLGARTRFVVSSPWLAIAAGIALVIAERGTLMHRRTFLRAALAALPAALAGCAAEADEQAVAGGTGTNAFEVTRTDAEWRKILTPDQYRVLRKHDTERSGSSPLNNEHRGGTYHCAGCDLPLYSSEAKFESGTGWPSFTAPLVNAIGRSVDRTLFAERTEVHCRRCGGHLGHVFDDGPPPTGKRYCMNGAAMIFKPQGA